MKMKIKIQADVYHSLFEYARIAERKFQSEIAGWGHYSKKLGIYKLTPLPAQEVSGAEVDAFPNELLSNTDYDISDMIVQWHSHVNMATTPSSVDNANIKDTMKIMDNLISIIVNCKGDYSARIDFRNKNRFFDNIVTHDVELVVDYHLDIASMEREVLAKCKKKLWYVDDKQYPLYADDDNNGYGCWYPRQEIPAQSETLAESANAQANQSKLIQLSTVYDKLFAYNIKGIQYLRSSVLNKEIKVLPDGIVEYDNVKGSKNLIDLFVRDHCKKDKKYTF